MTRRNCWSSLKDLISNCWRGYFLTKLWIFLRFIHKFRKISQRQFRLMTLNSLHGFFKAWKWRNSRNYVTALYEFALCQHPAKKWMDSPIQFQLSLENATPMALTVAGLRKQKLSRIAKTFCQFKNFFAASAISLDDTKSLENRGVTLAPRDACVDSLNKFLPRGTPPPSPQQSSSLHEWGSTWERVLIRTPFSPPVYFRFFILLLQHLWTLRGRCKMAII